MNRTIRIILILITISATRIAATDYAPAEPEWNRPVAPFRIAGNIYYVGAAEVASYLITTPKGHFLLNSGFAETVPQILRNIETLGFKPEDVRHLLIDHAHYDHVGGIQELRRRTGAKVISSAADARLLQNGGDKDFAFGNSFLYEPVSTDRLVVDGGTVTIDGTTMTAIFTPGHTRGAVSWLVKVREGGRDVTVLFLSSVTSPGYRIVGNLSYPEIASHFRTTFAKLEKLQADVLLASHGSVFGLEEKTTRLSKSGPNPFIDPAEFPRYLATARAAFEKKVEDQTAAAKIETNQALLTSTSIGRDFPATIDPSKRHVFFLHGKIVEDRGLRPRHDRFGVYEYLKIVEALEAKGLTVISEGRAAGTVEVEYAEGVVKQIERLLEAGVSPSHITVMGASKGSGIAMLASTKLMRTDIRFVVMANCNPEIEAKFGFDLHGEVLSIYDTKDSYARTCRPLFARSSGVTRSEEIALELRLGHGILYAPLPEWIEPATAWALR